MTHHELGTGLANRLLGDDYAADKEQLFHVTVTETEAERQPDGMADDFTPATDDICRD